MRKKDILAEGLYRSGAARLAVSLPRANNTLTILAYHRVLPFDGNFEFDEDLISATPEGFDWQMNHLRKHYNPMSFRQVAELIDRGEPLPARSVIVTFDDGFDDNFQYVYPALQKNNVPATFFITTDYIGTDTVFWFDWSVYLCKKLQRDVTLTAPGSRQEVKLLARDAPRERCDKLLRLLKIIPDADRKAMIQELENIVAPRQKYFAASKPMSWQQAREMQQGGLVEFGSHTLSHPVLTQMDKAAITNELSASKQLIENNLQTACTTFAYPVGGPNAINEEVLHSVSLSGYRFACTYRPGLNKIPMENPYLLRRLHIERQTTNGWFASLLAWPVLMGT